MNSTAIESAGVGPDSFLTLHYRVALTSEEAIDSDIVNTFDDKTATLDVESEPGANYQPGDLLEFTAHGVSRSVRREADALGLKVFDVFDASHAPKPGRQYQK